MWFLDNFISIAAKEGGKEFCDGCVERKMQNRSDEYAISPAGDFATDFCRNDKIIEEKTKVVPVYAKGVCI